MTIKSNTKTVRNDIIIRKMILVGNFPSHFQFTIPVWALPIYPNTPQKVISRHTSKYGEYCFIYGKSMVYTLQLSQKSDFHFKSKNYEMGIKSFLKISIIT